MTQEPNDQIARLEREVAELRSKLQRARSSSSALTSFVETVEARARSLARRIARRTTRRPDARPAAPVAETTSAVPRFFMEREPTPAPRRETEPDVTVVIPVYNSESWLDDCLSSVLAQTGPSLEVVCIDDGSTDSSSEVLDRYARLDPRVTVVHQPNSGQSVARNRGLDEARGRYVVFLDSDDFWPSDSLATLVADADADSLDMLLFDCFSFRDGDVPEAVWTRYAHYYQRSREYREPRSGAQMIVDMRRNRDYRPHVGMYLTRTDFARETGVTFIPGIVHQDNPYTFALMLRAPRTAHRRDDIYARRIRAGSTITALADANSVKGYLLSFLDMSEQLRNWSPEPGLTSTLSEVVYGTFEGAHKKFASLPREAVAELHSLATSPDAQIALQILTKAHAAPPRR